jgi:3'-phosphoadenosine 5'-phosphosulfate sulfotransferase (PAPS reductase)/FAD synthetase
MSNKKRGFISFSGGETSAYMMQWLLKNKSDEYDFIILFANTGCESEVTLDFVRDCSKLFSCKIVWVERDFKGVRKGGHKIVDYQTATRLKDWRNGKNPFEKMVQKFGLPNNANKFSTRELKLIPMESYLRSIGWESGSYDTFIGLRSDEIDRISKDRKAKKLIYPLIEYLRWTKKHINYWWSQQKFRLKLKGYQGNCLACYKKTPSKILAIFNESPELICFFDYLEFKYAYYVREDRIKKHIVRKLKKMPNFPLTMFRDNKNLYQYKELGKDNVLDDSIDINIQTDAFSEESCEIFTSCGIDN